MYRKWNDSLYLKNSICNTTTKFNTLKINHWPVFVKCTLCKVFWQIEKNLILNSLLITTVKNMVSSMANQYYLIFLKVLILLSVYKMSTSKNNICYAQHLVYILFLAEYPLKIDLVPHPAHFGDSG